ncbi:FGGY-family carbohydrate kinase [Clostridium tagluense]|uniref:Carbohydrate kinase n=1 Tax=Clostridium tagluense TaxID=360422 RepID=A0A401UIA6_9CLOT|nr:FGGY-family carbohydrate kinase [Clostridium tagluense]GCD09256.1 carbohydrate kinase [Clostridium tagluense]
MSDKYVLTIDCGTQSIRALIFDKNGTLLCKKKREFEPYFSNYPGFAEQNPEVYWDNLCIVCKELKEDCKEIWQKVEGVVVTTLRDTCINLDKENNVLRPAILWLDQRIADNVAEFSNIENLAFRAIGMKQAIDISQKKGKAYWIKQHQPEIWEKTDKYILISAYFHFKLTGKIVDSIANQIAHIPFDYKNKCWPKSNTSYRWTLFGIEREKLPLLVNPGEIIGQITKEASELTGIRQGTILIAGASDKGCETLGNGCLDTGSASISFGTTATVQTTSKKYFEPIKFMPAYPSAVQGHYNPEVEIFRGYWMISWFKSEFSMREMKEALGKGISPESLLNERLDEIPPGAHGLILQPYWGPGLKMPDAKGAIIGFGDVHTRAHIYRAIIEGINYALLEGIEKIEKKSGEKIVEIAVCGGGSQSDTICQITADMLNRKIYKGQTYEISGLGASIIGYVALGVYSSYEEAIKHMFKRTKEFTPNVSNAEIYRKLYKKIYTKIYPSLKNLYKDIKEITGYPKH